MTQTGAPRLNVAMVGHGIASSKRGRVAVDDLALFTARLSGGALGSVEATRFATGRKNVFRLEFSGSKGAIAFNLERMNQLEFYSAHDAQGEQGFRGILGTEPEHPYAAACGRPSGQRADPPAPATSSDLQHQPTQGEKQ
jgi:predicted dehydrogenase